MPKALVIAEHHAGELADSTLAAIGAALALEAETVDVAVLARDGTGLAQAVACVSGVARVLLIERDDNEPCLAAVWAPQIAELAGEYTHLLAGGTTTGKDLMPRVAALLGVGMLSDISDVESPWRFRRSIYAGNAVVSVEADAARLLCATVRTTAFSAETGEDAPAPVEHRSTSATATAGTRFVEHRGGRKTGPDLQTAERVVAGGRGLASAEAFGLVEELAAELGAAVGASRAAVDAGWVANDLQVGQTGKIIAPELYIAVGISGAIQHLTGIKDARTIVAINRDSDAPICATADLVLNEDLFAAVPSLIEALGRRKSG